MIAIIRVISLCLLLLHHVSGGGYYAVDYNEEEAFDEETTTEEEEATTTTAAITTTSAAVAPRVLNVSDFKVKVVAGIEALGPLRVLVDQEPLGVPSLTSDTTFHPYADIQIMVPAGAYAAAGRRRALEAMTLTLLDISIMMLSSSNLRICGPGVLLGPPTAPLLTKPLSVILFSPLPCSDGGIYVFSAGAWRPSSTGAIMMFQTQQLGQLLVLASPQPQPQLQPIATTTITYAATTTAIMLFMTPATSSSSSASVILQNTSIIVDVSAAPVINTTFIVICVLCYIFAIITIAGGWLCSCYDCLYHHHQQRRRSPPATPVVAAV